ncbi:hypothetical protein QP519_11175 [Weeksella virosa]|uniref:hypothetical protein n=1 Tax=Weeksella virosa TaxID=1014 RepID=UPI002556D67D|nr:hypothetical protein [Weeksella virosa]MDK7376093.1 hypothetical protein [Weeksella virosa]MDK7674373.1 hypothetical protein [Weeksella virosa]
MLEIINAKDMKKEYIVLNNRVKVENTRFLLTLNKSEKELYILHREFPRCLIYVEQTTPVNFIVVDFFEDNSKRDESIQILISEEFKQDLRDYFVRESFNLTDFN